VQKKFKRLAVQNPSREGNKRRRAAIKMKEATHTKSRRKVAHSSPIKAKGRKGKKGGKKREKT